MIFAFSALNKKIKTLKSYEKTTCEIFRINDNNKKTIKNT